MNSDVTNQCGAMLMRELTEAEVAAVAGAFTHPIVIGPNFTLQDLVADIRSPGGVLDLAVSIHDGLQTISEALVARVIGRSF